MMSPSDVEAKGSTIKGSYSCVVLKSREFSTSLGRFSEAVHPQRDMKKGGKLNFNFQYLHSDVVSVFASSLEGPNGTYSSSSAFGFEDMGGFIESIGGNDEISIFKTAFIAKNHQDTLYLGISKKDHLIGYLVNQTLFSNNAVMWWSALNCEKSSDVSISDLLDHILNL
tara:strand:+ start:187 stop:693 length:507 start_codon:yes stop_codon:yes gene_type:complete